MAVYVTRVFARFARKEKIEPETLIAVARDVASGNANADLGGGVFKQRIARSGGGKSGGYRVILFFKSGSDVFFAHGFAKNAKGNVSRKELAALKRLADVMLGFTAADLKTAIEAGEIEKLEAKDE